MRDGAEVSAGTYGEGDGGNLTVNASNQVELIGTTADGQYGSGLFTQASRGASGKAGDLTINTGTLLVRDGAFVSASTFGEGDGGNLTVNASNQVQLIGTTADGQFGSGLYASANPDASGKAGDLTINTGTLLVQDGAEVSAGTFGEGDGGNLTVNASNQVQLIGTSADGQFVSGLFASTQPGASGKAGDLTINTGTLLVRDGALVSVRSFQGQAGNMTILANSLLLDQGRLFAETAKSDAQGGANITLSGLDLLRMDNESLISANALDQASGGNITIDSTFVVATPPTGSKGSDITANAVRGNGGRVNITTQGLFGIEFRPQPTSKNDITVSSEFGLTGEFQLYSPDVDPSRGLTNLPTAVVDVSNQIAQTCPSGGRKVAQNQFIVTGRGGLPANPTDTLSSDTVWTDLRNPSVVSSHPSEEPVTPKAVTPQAPIMEANGWVINDKGEVVLMAVAPTVPLYSRGWTQSQCHVSQTSRE